MLTMAEYIDKQELLKYLFPIGLVDEGNYSINTKAVRKAIDRMPTVNNLQDYKLYGDFVALDATKTTYEDIVETKELLLKQCLSAVEQVLQDNKEALFEVERHQVKPYHLKVGWKILLPTIEKE